MRDPGGRHLGGPVDDVEVEIGGWLSSVSVHESLWERVVRC